MESSTSTVLVPSVLKAVLKDPDHASKITTVPGNWTNYIVWMKLASLYLYRRGKLGYVNGKIHRPDETETMFSEWEFNDLIGMSWLLNSIELSIAEDFLFLDSAREMWDSDVEIYRKKENVARIYQLQVDIAKAVKVEKAFHAYLSHLKAMWEELQRLTLTSTNLEVIKKREKEDRIFKLLADLRK
ncbi:unnamed protein product [Victoria cruziana]